MKPQASLTAVALSVLLTIGTCGFIVGGSMASAQAPAAIGLAPLTNMSVGETQRFDMDLKVTFLGVKNDSRCPMGVFCIAAGDAEVLLRVQVGNKLPQNISIHTNRKPQKVTLSVLRAGTFGIPKSYTLHVSELTPNRLGMIPKQFDYRLSLGVGVAL